MNLGRAMFRGVVGPLMFGHGTQKLFGWFGGYGPEGTGGYFESLGLRPGKRHALGAGASEALGGLLLTLGLLTPLGSSMITGTMVTAIRKVHASKGPWVTEGGFEYNAVLIAGAFALADSGPGALSLDARLFPRMRGLGWAIAQLAAGVAGSYIVTEQLNEASAEEQGTEQRLAGDPASASNGRPVAEPAGAQS
jgi:putative oxidoreductase